MIVTNPEKVDLLFSQNKINRCMMHLFVSNVIDRQQTIIKPEVNMKAQKWYW